MANHEPITFHDYEFHFANGKVLSVTMQDGRDTAKIEDDQFIFITLHDGGVQQTVVRFAELYAWQRFTRIEQPEPQQPGWTQDQP